MFQKDQDSFLQLNANYQEGDYRYSEKHTREVLNQLRAYLSQELKDFSVPINWTGYTKFQKAVLQQTCKIPYGETRSYRDIAVAVGSPNAFRAVGQAEKRNQIPLVIPCHRVIGSDGNLTGYGGKNNTDIKALIINFERSGIG
jgi:methylated-DNA-[protein]-cysteine S-methyltransferase